MGIGLYLKGSHTSSGKQLVVIKAKSKNRSVTKSTGIKVNPKDWIPRNSQVSASDPNHIIINRKLKDHFNSITDWWSRYESGSLTWEELEGVIKGGKHIAKGKSYTLEMFFDSVMADDYEIEQTKEMYLNVVKSVNKQAGREVQLSELTNELIDTLVKGWKKRNLSPASIESYLTHIGKLKRTAFEKGFIQEDFKRKSSWKPSRKKLGERREKIIVIAKKEEFEQAIEKAKTVREVQALSFWLLMFCMRGFYQADLVTMHLHANNLCVINSDGSITLPERTYIRHRRSKTGTLMEINLDVEPIWGLIDLIQTTLEITHKRINKRTGEPFIKGKNVLSDRYGDPTKEGFFFNYDIQDSKTHKNTWDNPQKTIRRILVPFDKARKTFESYALKLKISRDVRYKLEGHKDDSIKQHYQDWEWDELKDQVDEAHRQVLEDYNAKELFHKLEKKLVRVLM